MSQGEDLVRFKSPRHNVEVMIIDDDEMIIMIYHNDDNGDKDDYLQKRQWLKNKQIQ